MHEADKTQEDYVVDDLQKLLRRVNECEWRYKKILEASKHGIQVIGIHGRINYINTAHCEMLGYTVRELEGVEIWRLLANESDMKGLTAHLTKLAQEGYAFPPWEGNYVKKDRKIKRLQLNWTCMRDEHGNVIGFVSFTDRPVGAQRGKTFSHSTLRISKHTVSKELKRRRFGENMI